MAQVVTITIRMAFFDRQRETADAAASSLVNYAVDGLEAEIAYTTRRESLRVLPHVSDPDTEAPDDAYDVWQEKVRAVMDQQDEKDSTHRANW